MIEDVDDPQADPEENQDESSEEEEDDEGGPGVSPVFRINVHKRLVTVFRTVFQ